MAGGDSSQHCHCMSLPFSLSLSLTGQLFIYARITNILINVMSPNKALNH